MEAVKILEQAGVLNWDYDEKAAVLYIAAGEPQAAAGVDIGNGVILRYSEGRNEVAGLTLIGLRTRLLRALVGEH